VAISALTYNYPEIAGSNTAIISFSLNSNWLMVCSENKPAYFSKLCESSNIFNFDNIKSELEKAEELLSSKVKYLFLSGESLTPEIINDFKKSLSNKFNVINRLNAFRMLTTKLDSDHREYCNRMAHVFPSCIGAGMPESGQIIKVI
jgi:hypothetical protein